MELNKELTRKEVKEIIKALGVFEAENNQTPKPGFIQLIDPDGEQYPEIHFPVTFIGLIRFHMEYIKTLSFEGGKLSKQLEVNKAFRNFAQLININL